MMHTSFPIPPAWRWRLAIGFFVAVLFGLWLIPFIYHRVAKANFEAYVADLAAKGESLEVDDLRPPPIENPEDDVAAAPVFAEFLERCRKDPDANEENDLVWGKLNWKALPGYSMGAVIRPETKVSFLTHPSITQEFDLPDEAAAARAVLAHGDIHGETLSEIREAVARPRADLNAPYGDFTSPYPGLNAFQGIGEFLHRHGQAALFVDRSDVASSNAITMFRLSKHIGNQATLIHMLEGYKIHGSAILLIHEGLGNGEWNEENLRAFAAELEVKWLETAFLRAVRMERAGAMIIWKQLPEATELWEFEKYQWVRHFLLIPHLREGWIYDGSEFYSRTIQETMLEDQSGTSLTSGIVQPLRTLPQLGPPASSNPRDQIRFYVEAFRHGGAYSSFSLLSSIRLRTLRNQVFQDHALIAIALALHEREHGSFPLTLDGLTLPSGAPLPTDPFTGVNYLYRPEGQNDYLLYSPGPNGLDDGGLIRHRYEDGDWVWRLHLPVDFDYDAYRGQ